MNCKYLMCQLVAGVIGMLVLPAANRLSAQAVFSLADEGSPTATRQGEWLSTSMGRYTLMHREVRLTPQAEPKPALSIALIPNDLDLVDGNAAVQYLQAMAFAEQQSALEAMRRFQQKGFQDAQAAGKDTSMSEPNVWLQTIPADLPVERVKEYLGYSTFQMRYLEQAAQRRSCSFDRNIKSVENPIGYLLSEIQAMRELSRLQSMRFRLAIAENRPQDATRIFGQQLAMGHHLDSEEFLVSNLVGIACAGIGVNDGFFLSEQPSAPNLYWAIAALPQPLVSMRRSMAYERELFFEQFKQFRSVDETPLPPAFWQRFVREFEKTLAQGYDFGQIQAAIESAGMATLIAAAYPGAKLFLLEERGMQPEELASMPVSQVVLLAVRRYHEQARDELLKTQYLPHPQRKALGGEQALQDMRNKYGLVTALSDSLLPAIQGVIGARERLQQQLALLQTVEAIREHLASHGGQLPERLSDLRLPAPIDPLTFEPFAYHLEAGRATLSGSVASSVKYEFLLIPTQN